MQPNQNNQNQYTQRSVYPNITSAPNTNRQYCSTGTEYVDVINLKIDHQNFNKLGYMINLILKGLKTSI